MYVVIYNPLYINIHKFNINFATKPLSKKLKRNKIRKRAFFEGVGECVFVVVIKTVSLLLLLLLSGTLINNGF